MCCEPTLLWFSLKLQDLPFCPPTSGQIQVRRSCSACREAWRVNSENWWITQFHFFASSPYYPLSCSSVFQALMSVQAGFSIGTRQPSGLDFWSLILLKPYPTPEDLISQFHMNTTFINSANLPRTSSHCREKNPEMKTALRCGNAHLIVKVWKLFFCAVLLFKLLLDRTR